MNTEPHRGRILSSVVVLLLGVVACAPAEEALDVASGTIIVDTGLADAFAETLESNTGRRLAVRTVGSGEAFALAQRGDVDLLFVHEPDGLSELRRDGRVDGAAGFARTRWVIVGPAGDPARVEDASDFADAFGRIARAEAAFVSRGDLSGTHARELEAWKDAGVEPDRAWYGTTGQGQADTLRVAAERGAYALADEATVRTVPVSDLEVWRITDPDRWTVYRAVALRGPRQEDARRVVDFATSSAVRRLVADFGTETFGEPLFSAPT